MPSPYSGSPVSENGGSRPSSITRSSRESFVSELETLPSESVDYSYELNEEVLDIQDLSEDDFEGSASESSSVKQIEDEVNNKNTIENGDKEMTSPAESELECKIRRGLEKVKKLDKILLEKTEREKEVKRARRDVEREFQSQVAKLIEEKGADKVWGSQQLLYLCASSDRAEHTEIGDIVEPIFPTQIDVEYYKDKTDSFPDNTHTAENTSQNGEKTENKQKKGKDFVKRNIQLASQAQESILLTDEERKRLDELLADDSDLLMVENPFTSNAVSISGFQFSDEEQNALEKIDAQLKDLIPSDEFTLAIGDSQFNNGDSLLNDSKYTDDDGVESNEEFLIREAKCGEEALQKGSDARRVICRLRDIDVKLNHLKFDDEEGLESPIDPDLLRKLLDVNSRLTSDSISICESLHSRSAIYSDIDATTIGSEWDVDLNMSNPQLCVVTN